MKVQELADKLGMEVICRGARFDEQIRGGYVSDLLSDVMGHADEGQIWITLQVHRNVIAVAALKELAAVVLTSGVLPDEQTLSQAREEQVTILSTPLSSFEVAGRIYALIG